MEKIERERVEKRERELKTKICLYFESFNPSIRLFKKIFYFL
jgi:hypothetical protein